MNPNHDEKGRFAAGSAAAQSQAAKAAASRVSLTGNFPGKLKISGR